MQEAFGNFPKDLAAVLQAFGKCIADSAGGPWMGIELFFRRLKRILTLKDADFTVKRLEKFAEHKVTLLQPANAV